MGPVAEASPTLDTLPADAWRRLAHRRIYFGHQSVGYDILAGIDELLRERPAIRLRIVESNDPASLSGPALAHGRVGANLDPGSKLRHFAEVVGAGSDRWVEVAVLKFCYADIRAGSDALAAFEAYVRCMDSLQREHPGLRLLHLTVPLTALPSWPRRVAKAMLGRPAREPGDNLRRDEFNRLLHARYGATGRLFDLARIEATRPDGRLETCRAGDRTCPSLYPGYSPDRGHLGERGRRVVASAFLRFLAEAAS